jgi:hypothetical protein
LEPGTKAALVDSSTAALLNRQGRFLLLDLQAGKPISEQTLDAEPRLAGLHVVASREVLILIANRPQEDSDSERFEPAHENGGPMINGRVYAIDRRTGKSLWPAAATVENFALVLEQPLELPVVLFARRTQGSQKTSFLFLDKRTGALATPTRDYNRRINSFELVGDLEKKTATLHLRSMASTLTLSFTTETAPPEPPLQEIAGRARASKSGSAFGEALKELGKAVKELQKPPADRAQQEKDLFGDDP